MNSDNNRVNVERIANEAHLKGADLFGYYLVLRGPSPGAMPGGSVASVTFDERTFLEAVCANVWGWVCYDHPLTLDEVEAYELVQDEHNSVAYVKWAVEIKKMVRGTDGKRSVTSDWARQSDGEVFLTNYKGKAEQLARKLNDETLDANDKDHITVARVIKVQGKN